MKEGVVGEIVGVDISAPAIDDAKANAQLNGFGAASEGGDNNIDVNNNGGSKTRFVAARAEHVMQRELKQGSHYDRVIAVVDPARDGLHADVLKSIRNCSLIDRLIYVSCNPTGSLIKDAALLCTPASKRYRGRPFKPTFAQPVDMFPFSTHCELVMVFDRLADEELSEEERQNEKKGD
jgi:tRNA (uracil-5-)-methyltransferase